MADTGTQTEPRDHSWLYRQLEPSAWPQKGLSPTNFVLVLLVFASFLAFALETEPTLSPELQQSIESFNWLILVVFATEYCVRLYAAGEDPKFRGVVGRIRYMFTPYALTDLVAFLPELIYLFVVGPDGNDRAVAALKALRLFRLLKIARYIPAFDVLGAAMRRAGSQLLTTLALALALVYLSAILLYFIEGPHQPEAFGSIPRAVWWAIATLTTVGYGDVYPITSMGRIAASMIALAGIGVVALPAGVFASAFSDELNERQREKDAALAASPASEDTDPR